VLKTLWKDEEGLTTVEYALLLAIVAVSALVAWTALGSRVNANVSSAGTSLPSG